AAESKLHQHLPQAATGARLGQQGLLKSLGAELSALEQHLAEPRLRSAQAQRLSDADLQGLGVAVPERAERLGQGLTAAQHVVLGLLHLGGGDHPGQHQPLGQQRLRLFRWKPHPITFAKAMTISKTISATMVASSVMDRSVSTSPLSRPWVRESSSCLRVTDRCQSGIRSCWVAAT